MPKYISCWLHRLVQYISTNLTTKQWRLLRPNSSDSLVKPWQIPSFRTDLHFLGAVLPTPLIRTNGVRMVANNWGLWGSYLLVVSCIWPPGCASLVGDQFHSYTWNPTPKPTADTSYTPCRGPKAASSSKRQAVWVSVTLAIECCDNVLGRPLPEACHTRDILYYYWFLIN